MHRKQNNMGRNIINIYSKPMSGLLLGSDLGVWEAKSSKFLHFLLFLYFCFALSSINYNQTTRVQLVGIDWDPAVLKFPNMVIIQ